MATQPQPAQRTRLALRRSFGFQTPDGAWWPTNRRLSDQLGTLFALWPPDRGRVQRVLYSPPDWDDHPRAVEVPGRRIKTGSFPNDDTHQLTLTMSTGERRTIAVIPPETARRDANRLLDTITGGRPEEPDAHPEWDNEGGHT